MPNAILVAGNASRFFDNVHSFRQYLTREQLVTPKKIKVLPTTYIDEGMFAYRISSAIAARTSAPLLILFCGHGSRYGWALDDVRTFGYSQLATMLLSGKRPVTILNDCCHAMGAVWVCQCRQVPSKRISIIAATDYGETTSGGFTDIVLNSWSQRRPVRFGPELRWGEKFDHYYYSHKEQNIG